MNPLKIQAERNLLLAQAKRLQAKANLLLAAAGLVQEYSVLAQQFVTHIENTDTYAQTPAPTTGTVQAESQREGPTGNRGGTGCPSGPGDQAERPPESGGGSADMPIVHTARSSEAQ
jgi:hypothetical protein